jgi:hypothetical protein
VFFPCSLTLERPVATSTTWRNSSVSHKRNVYTKSTSLIPWQIPDVVPTYRLLSCNSHWTPAHYTLMWARCRLRRWIFLAGNHQQLLLVLLFSLLRHFSLVARPGQKPTRPHFWIGFGLGTKAKKPWLFGLRPESEKHYLILGAFESACKWCHWRCDIRHDSAWVQYDRWNSCVRVGNVIAVRIWFGTAAIKHVFEQPQCLNYFSLKSERIWLGPGPKFVVSGGAFYGSKFAVRYEVWVYQVFTHDAFGVQLYRKEVEYFVASKHTTLRVIIYSRLNFWSILGQTASTTRWRNSLTLKTRNHTIRAGFSCNGTALDRKYEAFNVNPYPWGASSPSFMPIKWELSMSRGAKDQISM